MGETELIEAAARIGVHVVFLPIPIAGAYIEQLHLIIVDSTLTPAWQRFTLAHEYVHALRGHDGPQSPGIEARVDQEAARMLVSATEYALAERIVGSHPAAIAEELGVPEDCVQAWQAARA